ncbi:MAG TPA: hypothetical protein VFR58_07080, partial [Flavisolibacter sp.]|nr:hypothetical protein [Flavisolibacter sp.]
GLAVPLGDGINNAFDIIIGHAFAGTLRPQDGAWRMDAGEDPLLAEKIGRFITDWMEKESVLPADHYTSAFPDLPERPSR